MTSKIEKRRAFIINVVYFIFILGAFYLYMHFAFGATFPFIVALIVAMVLQRPVNFFIKKTKMKRGLVSAVSVFFVLIAAGFLLTVIVLKIVNEISSLFTFLSGLLNDMQALFNSFKDWLSGVIHILPDSVEPDVREYVNNMSIDALVDSLGSSFQMSWLTLPLGGVWATAKQIPGMVIAFVITIVSSFFMTADYPIIRDFIFRQLDPDRAKKISKTKRVVISSVGKLFKAYIILICITFTEIFLGLNLLRLIGIYENGYIVSISILIALVDILPVLGTGTVLIPWAIFSFFTGKIGLGIGILLIYALITVLRQIIEPKLVANQVGLPAIATIMGMYLGSKIFGAIGLFLMPLLIIIFKLLNDEGIIHIFKTKEEWEESRASGKPANSEE